MSKAERRLAIAELRAAMRRYRSPNVRPEWIDRFERRAAACEAAIKALRQMETTR